jgi:hypothetical protein
MIDIQKLNSFHRQTVIEWHKEIRLKHNDAPWAAIEDNHSQNFLLWHEEDVARRRDVEDSRIVTAKRYIDEYNQKRNNAMERIDDWILSKIARHPADDKSTELHSETPGMMIDRLSIMALKEFHMLEQVNREDADESHREICAKKMEVLKQQQMDLSSSLRILLEDLLNGKKSFKVYR